MIMRTRIIALLLATSLVLSGCAQSLHIDGVTYQPYGIFDADANRDPRIVYRVSPMSVLWSIVFFETVFIPVLLVGFALWEPVRKIDNKESNT